jgi:hypothetical protein
VSAKYISPQLFWFPAFFGLAFPFLFLANFIFIVYWILIGKRTAIFPILAFIIAFPNCLRFVQISSKSSTPADLKVTSYNSMLFDLYNWKKNKDSRNQILSELAELSSDIVCLQEYYNSEEENDFHNTLNTTT